MNKFKRDVTSCDASRLGCPIEATTSEIDKVHDIVLTDQRAKELVEARRITWHSDFNFARTIGYEKAIDKMGAAFALWIISATV